MKWIQRLCAFSASRLSPRIRRFSIGWDAHILSAYRVSRRAEWFMLAGFAIAVLASSMRSVIGGWSLHPLAPHFTVYLGMAVLAAASRTRLQRWLYRSWLDGTILTLTKSEIDGALQLSYVLTTAGGLSLMSNHSRWFAVLVSCNIFAGIIVLDAARQLTRRQTSEGGITFAVVNSGVYGCVQYLLRIQVVTSMLALTWLLVRQL